MSCRNSETKADCKRGCRARNGTLGKYGLPYLPSCRPIRGSGDWSVLPVVQGKAQWSRPCLLGAARIGQVGVDTGHAETMAPRHPGGNEAERNFSISRFAPVRCPTRNRDAHRPVDSVLDLSLGCLVLVDCRLSA